MGGPVDGFDEETRRLESVRAVGSGQYLREYTGVLAETGEDVRILTLHPELAESDPAVAAFRQVSDQWYNASANATIRTIRDRGTEPRPWIAVPDDRNATLATVQPDLPPDAIETVVAETADALRTLGLYNTVHGHLSPDDIYVTGADGDPAALTVAVGGFGLEAAVRAAVDEYEPTAYTAPELLAAPHTAGEQTDVYGLGAVTYFALTGQAPVAGEDRSVAIQDGPETPPSAFAESVPADLDSVVMRALATRPDDRYDSAYAFSRAFLGTFDPDTFSPRDTADDDAGPVDDTAHSSGADDVTHDEVDDSSQAAGAAVSAVSDDGAETADTTAHSSDSTEEDDAPPDPDNRSGEPPTTDETSVTRRAAIGLFGMGALGAGGWYLSRQRQTHPEVTNPQTAVNVQWSYDTGAWVTGPPAVVDDTVYVGSEDGTVYALSATDGTEQWAHRTGDYVHTLPAVVDGTVYVASADGFLYALSATDGSQQWAHEGTTSTYRYTSPAAVDGTVYVGSQNGSVYALSAADGTQQWSYRTDGWVWSSPAVVDDTVYVGGDDGNVYALSAADGTEQWSYETGGGVNTSPAVVDGTVYVGSDDTYLYALSAESGAEQWAFDTGDSYLESSPAVVDGTVYIGGGDFVYALSTADGTEQWSYETGAWVTSSPAVAAGTVYVGSNDTSVYALSAADGTEQWAFETGEKVRSSPAVVDGTVYVGSGDHNVYALSER